MTQESQKRRIVLASLLKPVDDTRMTEKMAATLASHGQYRVAVIGYPSSGKLPPGVVALPLTPFRRLSLARWWARWQALRFAFRERPDVFIFSTYELIGTALVLKVLLGTRIIYDVRENYFRNIWYSEGLAPGLRWLLALLVRFQEKVWAPAIDHFLLAEKGYDEEFRFHRGGWTVVENKSLDIPVAARSKNKDTLTLLFSGTLSESTGVFRAIHLADVLHQHHAGVRLIIAGFAAAVSVRKRLLRAVEGKPFIRTIGINTLVPHATIVSLIQSADAGILAYPKLPHTMHAVPTKLFEYLQAQLPVITESDWPWIARFESCRPFVFADLDAPNAREILNQLTTSTLYLTSPSDASWSEEANRLLAQIKLMV